MISSEEIEDGLKEGGACAVGQRKRRRRRTECGTSKRMSCGRPTSATHHAQHHSLAISTGKCRCAAVHACSAQVGLTGSH